VIAIAIVGAWVLFAQMWQLQAPLQMDAQLFEAWLGCLPLDANVASVALRPLEHVPSGAVRSRSLLAYRRRAKLARVQIVNGSLYVTCPRPRGTLPTSACIEREVLTLLLLVSVARLPDVDFLLDSSENSCHKTFHLTRLRRGRRSQRPSESGVAAVFATETEDGCDNLLVPPRSLSALPDNARWHARASQGQWEWRLRLNRALWRGAATGPPPLDASGHVSSPRAKAVMFSMQHPELLDARFAWRSGDGSAGVKMAAELRHRGMLLPPSSFLTWEGALRYRAALVLDGNTVPDRLAFVMASMTAVLKQESPRREAFYALMEPYVHYIPVRRDLSDLDTQLRWALVNATRLHEIARAGAALALTHLSRRAVLCHWTSVLVRYARYVALPLELDPDAVHVRGTTPSSWPTIVEPLLGSSALRPMLSHTPARLEDLVSLLRLHATPCLSVSYRHVCVDIS